MIERIYMLPLVWEVMCGNHRKRRTDGVKPWFHVKI